MKKINPMLKPFLDKLLVQLGPKFYEAYEAGFKDGTTGKQKTQLDEFLKTWEKTAGVQLE